MKENDSKNIVLLKKKPTNQPKKMYFLAGVTDLVTPLK